MVMHQFLGEACVYECVALIVSNGGRYQHLSRPIQVHSLPKSCGYNWSILFKSGHFQDIITSHRKEINNWLGWKNCYLYSRCRHCRQPLIDNYILRVLSTVRSNYFMVLCPIWTNIGLLRIAPQRLLSNSEKCRTPQITETQHWWKNETFLPGGTDRLPSPPTRINLSICLSVPTGLLIRYSAEKNTGPTDSVNYSLKYLYLESEILELRHKNQETLQGSSSPLAASVKERYLKVVLSFVSGAL